MPVDVSNACCNRKQDTSFPEVSRKHCEGLRLKKKNSLNSLNILVIVQIKFCVLKIH